MNNKRLDIFLIKNNFCDSRSKAQEMIKMSKIKVNGEIIVKNNFLVNENDIVEVVEELEFVSRAGLKLKEAFEKFDINPEGLIVLDVGASTGGFSDCCLKNNVKKIYSLDVGTNQLHKKIKQNDKVVELSNTNIKDISKEIIADKIDMVVSDLSFISSKHMFENIKKLDLSENLIIISLIKPQFELTKEIVKKQKGVIKNKKYHEYAINNVVNFAKSYGFKVIKIINSPILGSEGNKEFLGLFIHER